MATGRQSNIHLDHCDEKNARGKQASAFLKSRTRRSRRFLLASPRASPRSFGPKPWEAVNKNTQHSKGEAFTMRALKGLSKDARTHSMSQIDTIHIALSDILQAKAKVPLSVKETE
ncbi:hypothetical protein AOLI_G00250160 [Acnodon oligacanthus]